MRVRPIILCYHLQSLLLLAHTRHVKRRDRHTKLRIVTLLVITRVDIGSLINSPGPSYAGFM